MNPFWAARCGATILTCWLLASPAFGQVERVWLTYSGNDPGTLTFNWTTRTDAPTTLRYTTLDGANFTKVLPPASGETLHHATPREWRHADDRSGEIVEYSLSVGGIEGPRRKLKRQPEGTLRIAVVADWQGQPDIAAIVKDDVHLLVCAGDQVSSLWQSCGVGEKDCFTPFAKLIDKYPDFFATTPFLPVLGNHDREIRPRGDRPPAEPVYDVDATAYRSFYALPDDEWKWRFDFPQFQLRLIALDLNHLSDQGTTYQTCHSPAPDGEQFRWYERLMNEPFDGRRITIYNERHSAVRSIHKGAWLAPLKRGSAAITGFGYFAERAEVDGLPCFNTSLSGKGAKYPDPKSKFFAQEDGYLLLSADRATNSLAVRIKNLAGATLDETNIPYPTAGDDPAAPTSVKTTAEEK